MNNSPHVAIPFDYERLNDLPNNNPRIHLRNRLIRCLHPIDDIKHRMHGSGSVCSIKLKAIARCYASRILLWKVKLRCIFKSIKSLGTSWNKSWVDFNSDIFYVKHIFSLDYLTYGRNEITNLDFSIEIVVISISLFQMTESTWHSVSPVMIPKAWWLVETLSLHGSTRKLLRDMQKITI